MSKLLASIFYKILFGVFFFTLARDTHFFKNYLDNGGLRGFSNGSMVGASYIFELLGVSGAYITVSFFVFLFIILLTSIYPIVYLRLMSGLIMWLSYSVWSGMTHFTYPRTSWVIASLAFIFFDCNKSILNKNNLNVVRFIQASCFAPYVMSGAWKLINLGQVPLNDILFAIKNTPMEHAAYFQVIGTSNPGQAEIFMNSISGLVPFFYFMVCCFQAFSFLPMIFHSIKKSWAIGLIIFHMINGFAFGFGFTHTVFGFAILVILTEELIQFQNSKKKGWWGGGEWARYFWFGFGLRIWKLWVL